MDNFEKSARRNELWSAYIYEPLGQKVPFDPAERWRDAISAIGKAREVRDSALAAGDGQTATAAACTAFKLWVLMSDKCAGWAQEQLLGDVIRDASAGFGPHDQTVLKGLFESSILAMPPTHRSALSHIATLLPTDLLGRLVDALNALGQDEVQPLFEPIRVQRHCAGWTWDQARIRAVEHVYFLVGYGMKKGDARRKVASKIGASPATIRHWDEKELPCRYGKDLIFWRETARAAGELDFTLKDNPGGWPGNVDAHAFAFRERLKDEPLSEFAEKFEIFEGRYWSAEAGK